MAAGKTSAALILPGRTRIISFERNFDEVKVMTPESKAVLMAKYAELTAGMDMTHRNHAASGKWYNATQIGAMFGRTPAMIGRTANEIGLKAPEGESNEYGRWAMSKPKHSPKEVMIWLYSENAVEWFRKFFGVENTA